MPNHRTGKYAIDKLPEVTRTKVLDALLAGASLRDAAKIGGVSHEAVKTYKLNVLLPALRKAQQIQSFQPITKPDTVRATEHLSLTRDVVKSSPFRDRLEKLWHTAERSLAKAESAVREVKDSDGNVVAYAQDLSAVAPILNQAHKNVELLGRVTGELEVSAGNNIAIQIVLPQAPAPAADVLSASDTIIDVTPKRS